MVTSQDAFGAEVGCSTARESPSVSRTRTARAAPECAIGRPRLGSATSGPCRRSGFARFHPSQVGEAGGGQQETCLDKDAIASSTLGGWPTPLDGQVPAFARRAACAQVPSGRTVSPEIACDCRLRLLLFVVLAIVSRRQGALFASDYPPEVTHIGFYGHITETGT
jgi:hypothetical protein